MDKGKTILILGAGIYQVPLICEAQRRGMRAVIASIPGNYPGFSVADKAYYTDTTDTDGVLRIARDEHIDAIVTTGTDVAVSTIGTVCRVLGLPGIGEEAARILTDKALMKAAFRRGGVTTAEFETVRSYDEAVAAAGRIGLPVMLKIVDKSGSRGITKITDLSQLRAAYDYALAFTRADHMVVEKFIEGREIGIDAFVQNGKLLMLLPHEKYVYFSGKTGIPIGHYCPMEASDRLYENMLSETEKVIRATGMDNCAVNIDAFVLPDERVNIIEAAGRCGATGIPEVITGYTGRNYYSCILDNALGIPVEPFDTRSGRPTASLLLYSRQTGFLREVRYRFAGRDYCNENADVPERGRVELSFGPGDDIDAFQNGTDRIGQAVFYARTNEALQTAVEDFRRSLTVTVDA
ncbi:MAG: ATP-grasp domain-containing protein [Oscillospiraceae bacterium]|nr:ATP-grasp domain-containing protein [Oscillospiraceae bacterium]